jgi:hypothetical protein
MAFDDNNVHVVSNNNVHGILKPTMCNVNAIDMINVKDMNIEPQSTKFNLIVPSKSRGG